MIFNLNDILKNKTFHTFNKTLYYIAVHFILIRLLSSNWE